VNNFLSRKEALAVGESLYYTGKPCQRGHIAPRRVSTYSCLQCCKEIYHIRDRDSYRANPFYRQFTSRKQKAEKAGIPYTIKFEDIEQPKYCPVFGIELNYGWSGEGTRDNAKATLDKLDPTLGYIPGNVFVISWKANRLKNNMSYKELLQILNYIRKNTHEHKTI
jgi:hypothetical protein